MYEKELSVAKKAVEEASRILMKYWKQDYKIRSKSDEFYDIVTSADLESEENIINIIKKEFPDHEILAEESGSTGSHDYVWVIDPLDGTVNFSRSSPIFGISIGLMHKNELVLGVISLPALNQIYWAIKGEGAYANNQIIHVSDKDGSDASIYFAGVRKVSHDINAKNGFLSLVKEFPANFRLYGCAVYNSTSVATGKAEALVSYSEKPVDVAAGILIVQEAGGIVTDIEGNEATIYSEKFILSNKKIHGKIIDALKSS